jgi:hypothetical protein
MQPEHGASHSIIHLEMGHTRFEMWFNFYDRPTQQIVATKDMSAWVPVAIHVQVGYLGEGDHMQVEEEEDILCETHEQATDEFIRLFEYCLAFGLRDTVSRGENLVLDVFRQGRSKESR